MPPSIATPTAAPTSNTPAVRALTVVAGGDVLLHPPTVAQADADGGVVGDGVYDFTPELAGIEPLVSSADLALCHMETPLAESAGPFSGYPSFNGPPQVADGLAAVGFDACSMASNHSYDQGLAGVMRTADTLSAAGITPYGAAIGDHRGNPTLVDVPTDTGSVRVGLLSYAYGFNDAVPSGAGDTVENIDPAAVTADASAARAAGAEIVIASVHWGTEYDHEPNAMQLSIAPLLVASPDLDLVISHHAHVVEPFTQINGTWVTYGLGNMLAAHATALPDNQEGVLAEFTFMPRPDNPTRWTVSAAAYQAIIVERGPPLRIVELPQAMVPGLATELRERYETALERTRGVVTSLDAHPVELGSAPSP